MAWPATVVNGQLTDASQYNNLLTSVQTWGGSVSANSNSLTSITAVSAPAATALNITAAPAAFLSPDASRSLQISVANGVNPAINSTTNSIASTSTWTITHASGLAVMSPDATRTGRFSVANAADPTITTSTGTVVIGGIGKVSNSLIVYFSSTASGIFYNFGFATQNSVPQCHTLTVTGAAGIYYIASPVQALATLGVTGATSISTLTASGAVTFNALVTHNANLDLTNHVLQNISNGSVQASVLANIALTGNYNDLSNTPAAYALPIATASVLGGVKQGAGVTIAADGTLSGNVGGVRVVVADTTLNNSDYLVVCGAGANNITMPVAPVTGQVMVISNNRGGATPLVTVLASPGQQMLQFSGAAQVGAASCTIGFNGIITLIWDGTTYWRMLDMGIAQPGLTGYNGILQPATAAVLGGVKQGSGVVIAADGTLTAAATGMQIVTPVTANYTAVAADQSIAVFTPATNINLYASPVAGQVIQVINYTSGSVNINGNTHNIGAVTNINIYAGQSITFWYNLSSNIWQIYNQTASSWMNWTPTLTAGATTVSALVINDAQWQWSSPSLIHFKFNLAFTLSGTQSNQLAILPPVPPVGVNQPNPCWGQSPGEASTNDVYYCITLAGSNFSVRNLTAVNLPLGNYVILSNGSYRIA